MGRAKRKPEAIYPVRSASRGEPDYATLPAGFYRSLGTLLAGESRLDDFRADLANFLFEVPETAPSIKAALLQAYAVGRLPAHIHVILKQDIRDALSEDCVTESFYGEMDASESESLELSEPASPDVDGDQSAPPAEPVKARIDEDEEEQSVQLRPGVMLGGRYLLDRAVKGGHVGAVYRAEDQRRVATDDPEQQVAIKVVSPRFRHSAAAARALRNEARLTRSLSHTSIVRIHDFDVAGETEFIVMEWLDGESLAARLDSLRPHPMPPDEAFGILRFIASALDYAHEQEITHGDVKPGNVFLLANGRAKLLDFGLAVPAPEREDDDGPFAVSKAYASCELLEGNAATPADDVFAVACMAYRMLSGQRVFGGYNAYEARERGARLVPIPELSAGQWEALEAALSFDPAQRPLTVGELVDGLSRRRRMSAKSSAQSASPQRMLAEVLAAALIASALLAGAAWLLAGQFGLTGAGTSAGPEMTGSWLPPFETPPADMEARDSFAASKSVSDATIRPRDEVDLGGLIGFDRAEVLVGEDDGHARIVVRGGAITAANLRVLATTVQGTAAPGADYRHVENSRLGRSPDSDAQMLEVELLPDSIPEPRESFTVRLDAVDHLDQVRDSAEVTVVIADSASSR